MSRSDKYEFKYIGYQTGGNTLDIVEFINSMNNDVTDQELLSILKNQTYCNKILGSGVFGFVYVPLVSNVMQVTTSSNKKINMNIVVKKANQDGDFFVKNFDKKIYIYGNLNITMEAIVLAYINKLWHKKLSPHLPFMIGYSNCNDKMFVDQIITERHGLLKNIEINVNGYDGSVLLWGNSQNDTIFDTNLATLFDLIKYILITKKGNNVELPNGKKVNIIKLIDYLCISYIHTHNLLHKNNIIISDMHHQNIFIHWLNKDSYLDDLYIGDTKYIYYKINNKIIKIETFGILLKIGDIGTSIVIPNKNVTILGQSVNPEKNLYLLEQMIKPNYSEFSFFSNFKYSLPFSIYKKTIMFKILSTYPYNEIAQYLPSQDILLKKLLTPDELLNHYDKYTVPKIDKHKNIFIVPEY